MSVTVSRARGWKCDRCWRVLPEVGLCPDHPGLCLRCVSVVTGEDHLPIFEWAADRFDIFLAAARAAGAADPVGEASDLNVNGARNE